MEPEVWSARCHALRQALRRIELRHPAIPTVLAIDDQPTPTLVVTVKSHDRDGGHSVSVTHRFTIPDDIPLDRFVRFAEQRVCASWVHEVEESLHLDGVRIREPHRNSDVVYRFVTYGTDDLAIE